MQVSPIGIVHSTFCEPEGTPIQAAASIGSKAIIEVYDEYMEGLKDIDGFEEKNEFLSKHFKSFSFRLSEINQINTDLILSNKEEFLTRYDNKEKFRIWRNLRNTRKFF